MAKDQAIAQAERDIAASLSASQLRRFPLDREVEEGL